MIGALMLFGVASMTWGKGGITGNGLRMPLLFGVASMTWGKGGITGNGLRMPLLFGDGMVVMRNEPFRIYGMANASQQVFI